MDSNSKQHLVDEMRSARWQAFPPNTVAAVIPTARQAESASQELSNVGVSDADLMLVQGTEGGRILDPDESRTWMESFARMVQELGDARIYLEKYAAMVSQGRSFIAVRYETPNERDQVIAILQGAGALMLGYTEDATFVSKIY